jgi:hypothetical protein
MSISLPDTQSFAGEPMPYDDSFGWLCRWRGEIQSNTYQLKYWGVAKR